ncbi:unnamed protein product [Vicia faba]|uniref:Uncharacterized protein n=1 Tax=Vicia faba TaxID=3906 RepID=A0AAV1A8M4_VICFA|nr:unnamed protein product [Vicia faba]
MVQSTTPSAAKSSSVNVIDIIDISDDEFDISHNGSGNVSLATCLAGEKEKDLDHNAAQNNETLDFCGGVLFDMDVSNCEVTSSKSQDGCNADVDPGSDNSEDLQDCRKDSNSQDVSDDDMNFGKILSKIQREKKHEIKWEFEADMVAELGKDPVLCMKAVCSLYRQQTDDKQAIKGTLHRNGRGFNYHDADRKDSCFCCFYAILILNFVFLFSSIKWSPYSRHFLC